MLLYLTARGMELTDALRTHVEDRIVRAVERHGGESGTRMEVQLYEAGHREVRFGCHVLLHVPQNHELNVREEAGDLYAAIDLAEACLVRDLVDFRERRLTEARHPKKYYAARIAGEEAPTAELVPDEGDEPGAELPGGKAE